MGEFGTQDRKLDAQVSDLMCGLHSDSGEGESGEWKKPTLLDSQGGNVFPGPVLDSIELILQGFVKGLGVLGRGKELEIFHKDQGSPT